MTNPQTERPAETTDDPSRLPPPSTPSQPIGGTLRVHFRGTAELPLPPDANIDDEQELAAITSQAIAGMTAEDWAGAVHIEGTELVDPGQPRA